MKTCTTCSSNRIAVVSGKTSDCCFYSYKGQQHNGYVPSKVGIGYSDYIDFNYCLECGKIQGDFPVSDPKLNTEDY